jgi:outer membrane murein-binding lipoprotein Lpp
MSYSARMKNNSGIRVTTQRFLIVVAAIAISAIVIFSGAATSQKLNGVGTQAQEKLTQKEKLTRKESLTGKEKLPDKEFTRAPEKPTTQPLSFSILINWNLTIAFRASSPA